MPDLGPPEEAPAPEPLTEDERKDLLGYLRELRRVLASQKELERYRKEEIYPLAIPLLKKARAMSLLDPLTGEQTIAGVRSPETLVVDYDKLVELAGEDVANSVCKPREVDTKDDGLFRKAVTEGRIPMEIVAEVSSFKTSATSIGWSKPNA